MKGALYSKRTLSYLRAILMDRRKRLAHAVESELSPSGGHHAKMSTDLLDAAIESSTHDLALQMAAVGANEVQCIDRALKRIEDGSYGICGDCGESIAEARLKALPFAEFCVKCQQASERQAKEEDEDAADAPGYDAFSEGGDSEGGSVRIKGRKLS